MRRVLAIGVLLLVAVGVGVERQLPTIGAGALLHPSRHTRSAPMPAPCDDVTYQGADVSLAGWRCHAVGVSRGTIVYLHGIADNRGSAAGVIMRFQPRGFDVIAYDSRAHGSSGGDACTYGYFEKEDLRRVLDTARPGPVVLIGTSLGGAVALQAAAEDRRVRGIVAAETFADLRRVARERMPFFVWRGLIDRALASAEAQGRFVADAVSPVNAARRITAPVLLIHGEKDTDTSPEHSRHIQGALAGPRQLLIIPGAAHNESLGGSAWNSIDRWVDVVTGGTARAGG